MDDVQQLKSRGSRAGLQGSPQRKRPLRKRNPDRLERFRALLGPFEVADADRAIESGARGSDGDDFAGDRIEEHPSPDHDLFFEPVLSDGYNLNAGEGAQRFEHQRLRERRGG